MNIVAELNRLSEYKSQRDVLELRKKDLLNEIIPAEIRQRIDEVEAEFSIQAAAVDSNIEELTEQIKKATLQAEQSIYGKYLSATYNCARINWDTEKLNELSETVPEIEQARNVGQPYISIRNIKGKNAN